MVWLEIVWQANDKGCDLPVSPTCKLVLPRTEINNNA
jgi:hypothetical protein